VTAAGDRLVLVTDGIAESRSTTGEFFGRARLEQLITANHSEAVEVLVARIIESATAFRGAGPQADDITVLAAAL
jgi:serine phosphatase RsbU (regulator of sigma subunit)